jgi:hypothetical protein
VLLVLVGCASPAAESSPLDELGDLTLVESKAPAQLLRNEAASRVPTVVVQDVAEMADASVSCLGADVDPGGLARQWQSTATFLVTNSQAARVVTVAEGLAASFADQGWAPEVVDGATMLSSESSPVVIAITAVPKSSGMHAEIRIATTGPCVLTDGPGSDEVVRLETTL